MPAPMPSPSPMALPNFWADVWASLVAFVNLDASPRMSTVIWRLMVIPYLQEVVQMKTKEGWGTDKRGHVGAPPACHPDRPFHALGLCCQCYKAAKAREYRAAHPERVAEQARKQHAKALRNGPGRVPVHGMSKTPEYNSWKGMLHRCYDSKSHSYPWYGARGVVVCDRWRADFMAFYADVGPRPDRRLTLDRIDPSGNYEPGNVRWATWAVQATNKRRKVA
jgi:hypothetical protein